MKSYNEIFAENLQRIMKEKGWSQRELSRKIGASPSAVNLWYRGESVPRAGMMDKLCQLLDVSPIELTADKTGAPNLSVPAAHPLPILGRICCGEGIHREENFDGYFFVDNSIRADYCLRVEGDSMKDANICHGDIAFIRKSYGFLAGGIYAVVFGENENAVLRKVYSQNDGFMLMPCNQKYDPVFVDDAVIVGECVGVYRSI